MVPTALTPAARINGELVWESMDILNRLEREFTERPLLPEAPAHRAEAEEVTKAAEPLAAAGFKCARLDSISCLRCPSTWARDPPAWALAWTCGMRSAACLVRLGYQEVREVAADAQSVGGTAAGGSREVRWLRSQAQSGRRRRMAPRWRRCRPRLRSCWPASRRSWASTRAPSCWGDVPL
jgi:hypothetical protein